MYTSHGYMTPTDYQEYLEDAGIEMVSHTCDDDDPDGEPCAACQVEADLIEQSHREGIF